MSSLEAKLSDLPNVNARLSRGEVAVVVLIVACGFMLRAASPTTMAVEHFDEGVYASNYWFGEAEEYRYPMSHLYAPPLLPSLLYWTVLLFGPSSWGTMLVGIFCGGCTVGVVWWVARQWFGVESGIAAATLAAFSDFHILYSRTALTDVPLSLWMLLAVYFIWEAFRTLRLRWIFAAGLATGLAWWTKYNGWLPLAVGLAGLIPWVLVHKHLASDAGSRDSAPPRPQYELVFIRAREKHGQFELHSFVTSDSRRVLHYLGKSRKPQRVTECDIRAAVYFSEYSHASLVPAKGVVRKTHVNSRKHYPLDKLNTVVRSRQYEGDVWDNVTELLDSIIDDALSM